MNTNTKIILGIAGGILAAIGAYKLYQRFGPKKIEEKQEEKPEEGGGGGGGSGGRVENIVPKVVIINPIKGYHFPLKLQPIINSPHITAPVIHAPTTGFHANVLPKLPSTGYTSTGKVLIT